MSEQTTISPSNQALRRAIENEQLDSAIESIMETGLQQGWQGLNPVAETERLILQFFGWDTGGKAIMVSGLEEWKIHAVIKTLAAYQTRYREAFESYFGRTIDTESLQEDAAGLSDTPLKSFAGFMWDRLPAEAAKLTGDLKSARALVVGTAVLVVALTAYNLTKK